MLRWAMPTEDIAAVADIVPVHGAERADVAALVMGERIVTYGELHARSSQVANAFQAAGVRSGDRVAFIEKNGVEFFEVTYGLAKLGAVVVPVNWRLAPPEMAADHRGRRCRRSSSSGSEFARPHREPSRTSSRVSTRSSRSGTTTAGQAFDDWIADQPTDDPGVATGPRRHRLPALHLGHHRPAQGCDAEERATSSPWSSCITDAVAVHCRHA